MVWKNAKQFFALVWKAAQRYKNMNTIIHKANAISEVTTWMILCTTMITETSFYPAQVGHSFSLRRLTTCNVPHKSTLNLRRRAKMFDNIRQCLSWRWLQTVRSNYRHSTPAVSAPPLNASITTLSLFVNAVTTYQLPDRALVPKDKNFIMRMLYSDYLHW